MYQTCTVEKMTTYEILSKDIILKYKQSEVIYFNNYRLSKGDI